MADPSRLRSLLSPSGCVACIFAVQIRIEAFDVSVGNISIDTSDIYRQDRLLVSRHLLVMFDSGFFTSRQRTRLKSHDSNFRP